MRSRHVICAGMGLIAACGSGTHAPPLQPGELIGRVEVSAGVVATSCTVLLEGTPLGAHCDQDGAFDVKRVPPGRWDLRILTSTKATALPSRRIPAASNPGIISDVGPIQIAHSGSIGGHIINTAGADLSLAIVAVPEIGVVTAPNPNNGFLLENVSPGIHDIVLITDAGATTHRNVNVLPDKVALVDVALKPVDLDLMMLVPSQVFVTGRAFRANDTEDAHSGIVVKLIESLNGSTIDQT